MRSTLYKQRHANWQQVINISFLLPFLIVLTSVILLFAGIKPTAAATSDTLNFNGRLASNTGATVSDGSYNMQFRIYDDPNAGTNWWTETQTVTVQNGYFSVYLGEITPFGATVPWDQELWMTLNVESDGEMTPRFKLTAVPYAFRAGALVDSGGNAKTADDFAQLAPSNVQAVNAALAALRFNQTGSGALLQLQGDGADVFVVDKSGGAVLGAGLTVGNSSSTTAGTIRWNGADLEVYNGSSWDSLTTGGGGGGGSANTSASFISSIVNLAGTTTGAATGLLTFTSGTAVSSTAGSQTFTAPADGSFRSCLVVGNANRTGGTATLRWRVNGVSVGAGACVINATNIRASATTVDPGIVTFVAGDVISVVFDTTGLTPAGSTEYTVHWAVEYESTAASGYFEDGGNAFGGTAILGTTDNFGLNIITDNSVAASISSSGSVNIANDLTVGSGLVVSGGIDNNGGGISDVGAISGLTSISAVGTLTLESGGGSDLVFDSASGVVVLSDDTLRRSASGTTTIDLLDNGGGTTLSILNSDGSQVAGLTVEGIVSAAGFSGDGSAITALNGSAIASGTIADGRLSSNVALLDQNQNFTGLATFSSGLILGDSTSTTAGAIRWNGAEFQGYNGVEWAGLGGGGSPMLADQSVFFAYDSAGDINITGGWTDLTLDTEVKEDAPYVHSVDSAEVEFDEDGWYEITYDIGTYITSGGNRTSSRAKIQEDVGSGYVDVPGSQATMYNRNVANGFDSASATVLREFNAGDSIKIQAEAFNGTDTVLTEADTVRLNIKKFVTSGGGGGGMEFTQGGNDFAATAVIGTTGNNDFNLITDGTTALSLTTGNQAIFSGEILANGGLTIGNASSDGFIIVSDEVTLTNGLSFDSGTFTIDSASDFVGINTASPANRFNINDADTADGAAQALIATGADSNKGLVVQGESGQTANLLELQDNNGVVLGGFNGSGGLVLGLSTVTSAASGAQTVNFGDESGTVCLSGSTSCGFLPLASGSFVTDATTNDSIAINKTGASGNLLALQKNGGAVFTVSNTGALQIQNTSSAALDIRNVGGTSFFSVDTSTGTVRIGPSVADATGVLFVLDTKNTTGDPAGTDGALYYNSNIGRFRCFEDGDWKDCIGTRQVRSFIDTVADVPADNNTTNYWDTGVENNNSYPNITPATSTRSVTGTVGFEIQQTGGTADHSIVARIERSIGTLQNCGSGTPVGTILSAFTTNNGEQASNTMVFLDSPATTSQVFYRVCSDSASVTVTQMQINRIRVTLEEANNSN